jgi:hypothetical protein
MKQFILFITFLSCVCVNATVRTVSNSPATLAQFNTIQAAINASSTGDTIYVHGSPNIYAGFIITGMQLTIIGPGWSPDKNLPLTARIDFACNINGAASSGTEIQGLTFNGSGAVVMQNGVSLNNLRFIRNQFINAGAGIVFLSGVATTYTGCLIEGNYFNNSQVQGSSTVNTFQNFLFQDNLFYENGTQVSANISNFITCINVLFDHNLWYGPPSGTRDCFSGTNIGINLTNNIFVRRDAASTLSNSTFTNNLTFNAGNNTPWSSNGNVDGGGNLANTDPQMTDQVSVNAGANNPLLDFTIAAGPANNAGTDGKDMGLLYDVSGSLNWANSRSSRLPRIFSMNVTTPTVPAGGSVSVSVVAKTSN